MCGIVALINKLKNVRPDLIEGIKALQNRGYDSAGAFLMDNQDYWVYKCTSSNNNTSDSIEKLTKKISELHDSYSIGMCHTRWATHGAKTEVNAHPHHDSQERFYVVHNGVITNYAEIKNRLKLKGYKFLSETDTEVVPLLMEDCMKSGNRTTFQAWNLAVRELEGTFALIMCDTKNPSCLYIAKNGSPLVMSYSTDDNMIGFGSELAAFSFSIKQYTNIIDGTIMECSWRKHDEDWSFQIKNLKDPLKECKVDSFNFQLHETLKNLPKTPEPFQFWTEKEIHDQPFSLAQSFNCGGRLYMKNDEWRVKLGGLEKVKQKLSKVKHIIMVACGSSLHAAMLAAQVYRQITQFVTVQTLDASEFTFKDLPKEPTAVILISQSGETKDCHRVLELVKDHCITIGIVNVVGSLISRETDCGVYLNCGREVGVAATKSFTSQSTVLTLLGLWFAYEQDRPIDRWAAELCQIPKYFENHMKRLSIEIDEFLETSTSIMKAQTMFLLGRGYSYPIVLEAALKIKELCYIHAEGFAGGSLKHGSFALIDPNQKTPVFLNIFRGPNEENMISAAEQVTCRDAETIIVTNNKKLYVRFPKSHLFYIDVNDEFSASLVSVLFYQLLACKMAMLKKLNVDFPRNLAKTVSVDG